MAPPVALRAAIYIPERNVDVGTVFGKLVWNVFEAFSATDIYIPHGSLGLPFLAPPATYHVPSPSLFPVLRQFSAVRNPFLIHLIFRPVDSDSEAYKWTPLSKAE